MSTQNENVARFARNVEWDFFCDFQTLCIGNLFFWFCLVSKITVITDKRERKEDTSSFKILLQEGIDSIKNLTKKVFSNENDQESSKIYNFTHFAQSQKEGNLSYVGFHVTLYEHDKKCRLEDMGSRAKVLWLWKTSR